MVRLERGIETKDFSVVAVVVAVAAVTAVSMAEGL